MTTDNIRFIHVRGSEKRKTDKSADKRLNYTLAYTFTKNGDVLDVAYGVAQCRTNETFNKRAGRDFAVGRLNKALAPGKRKQNSIYAGRVTLQDFEGQSVGKALADTFEADRKQHLAELDATSYYRTMQTALPQG